MDLQQFRREYLHGGLRRSQLLDNPMDQFQSWMQLAIEADAILDPTAMNLATVDNLGQPSQRVVLLKQTDARGFVFFTNLDSSKARNIAQNGRVSLHFGWLPLERQVSIVGQAEPMSAADNEQYFHSRPRESQLAAWASHQSQPIDSREQLQAHFETYQQRYADQDVPLPDFWGGYRVVPERMEFWQGGANRLHDRFRYTKLDSTKDAADASWKIERLQP